MKERKEKRVSAIKNGTVIDHIPSNSMFKVISMLNLDQIEYPITFGTNLKSNKDGTKGIIKISDIHFDSDDLNKIALVAPKAVLNVIKDYEVTEKQVVDLPDKISGIVKCVNPKCITNVENVKTKFNVVSKKPVHLHCHYCEKITTQDLIQTL